jgi:hypothetical protein
VPVIIDSSIERSIPPHTHEYHQTLTVYLYSILLLVLPLLPLHLSQIYISAVIVVGIIFAIFNGITLILAIVGTAVPGTVNNVNDDQAQELINDRGLYILIVSAISLVFAVLAILGALWYNIWLLALNIVWFVSTAYCCYVSTAS